MTNNVVTKKSLVDVVYNDVHDRTKISKKNIAEIVDALFSEMKADLELGNHLRIADFGTFKVIDKVFLRKNAVVHKNFLLFFLKNSLISIYLSCSHSL